MVAYDATTELFYGGAWHEAPRSTRDPLTITRGRSGDQAAMSPSQSTATVDNYSGNWNPYYPLSPLYGVAGRNTPVRHYLGTPNLLGDSNVSLTAASSLVAPSLTAPAAGLLVCGWVGLDTAATWTLPASMSASGINGDSDLVTIQGGRQNVSSGATGTRTATLSTSHDYVAASVFIQGPTTWSTGSLAPPGNSFTLDVADPGDLWVLISAFASATGEDPPDVPAYPADTDGGGWVLLADTGNQQVTRNGVEYVRLKAWVKKTRTVNDTHQITLPGADDDNTISWATRVPADDVSGDWDVRHHGEVAEWALDRSLNFEPDTRGTFWTGVTGAGVLRRLGQGNQPVLSALTRSTLATDPSDFWSMEDGQDSDRYASALLGHAPMVIHQNGAATLAAEDSLPGSSALPRVSAGPQFTEDHFTQYTPLSSNITASEWTATWWMRTPKESTMTAGEEPFTSFVTVRTTGGDIIAWSFGARYNVDGDTDEYEFYAIGSDDNLYANVTDSTDHTDDWRHVRVVVTSTGSTIRLRVWIDGASLGDESDSRDGGSPSAVQVAIQSNTVDPGAMPSSLGQLAFWSGEVDPDLMDAGSGWPGETAGDRLLRMCGEVGVSASILADPDDTVPMGPQPVATLADLLAEIERTDGGILYEPRNQSGVVYRTRTSLYNQTAALELDWDDGFMAKPFDPVADDRYTRNDVTARRPDGSFARTEQAAGPLNVQQPEDDPEGVGRYATEVSVNPESDADLPNLAGWYLRLGTVESIRFPSITVDFDLYPDVVDAAAAVDIGDLITVDNVPVDLVPEQQLRLIVVGYTETIKPQRRTITFNCAPAAPYDQVAYADGTKRVDSAGTVRGAAQGSIDSTQTSLTLTPPAGESWATSGVFPFDVVAGGERMTVTAVAAKSGATQPFTVTRSVNGVVKSHPAGTAFHVVDRAYVAL